jgi:hypothetical protein
MADANEPEMPAPAEEIFQPWQLAGESRRDCEPHRAQFLSALAYISLLLGGLSFLCLLPGFLGLVLGLMTGMMARRDLDLIVTGDMDQRGYAQTDRAWGNARAAMKLSFLGLLAWAGLLVFAFLLSGIPRFP